MQIVFVGAGHASSLVIHRFIAQNKQISGCKVTLINENRTAVYSGMVPGVVAGNYAIDDATLDVKRLMEDAGGEFICAKAEFINWDTKSVTCKSIGDSSIQVHFDIIIVDIGSTNKSVPGIQYAIPTRPISILTQRVEEYERRIENIENVKCIVVGAGVAGIELLFCLSSRWKQKFPNKHITFQIIDSNADFCSSLNSISLGNRIKSIFDNNRELEYTFNARVESVQEDQVVLKDGTHVPYNVLIWACGAAPVDFSFHTGVELDTDGYIKVNENLQSISHRELFAAGDCIRFCTNGIPKSGVYAVREAPILFQNILLMIEHFQEPSLVPYKPQSHFLKLINMGDNTAIAEWFGMSFGPWSILYFLKHYIDTTFMKQFR